MKPNDLPPPLELAIMEVLNQAPFTAHEVADYIGRSIWGVAPVITKLFQEGYVRDTGEKALNWRSGRRATVWVGNTPKKYRLRRRRRKKANRGTGPKEEDGVKRGKSCSKFSGGGEQAIAFLNTDSPN